MLAEGSRQRSASLLVLGATALILTLGYLQKAPCVTPSPPDARSPWMCFTDVASLYTARGIDNGRIPYLEARNEYPVLTGLAIYAAGALSRSAVSFFNWTAALLAACGLMAAGALHAIASRRALMFALSPTLLVMAFFNWDLLTVALATLGFYSFLRDRDAAAGALLGLGTAAKLYPALLLVPSSSNAGGADDATSRRGWRSPPAGRGWP